MFDPDLHHCLLSDLHRFAVPRHARWDPLGLLGLLGVRSTLRERLGALGLLEEHHFGSGSEAGTNLILRLPGHETQRPGGPAASQLARRNPGCCARPDTSPPWSTSPRPHCW